MRPAGWHCQIPERETVVVDTVPPVITVSPREQYHAKIFHVTLSSNKEGTIWFKVLRPGGRLVLREKMDAYRNPITVSEEGETRVYFFGEDLLGNKSRADSIIYILDTKAPGLSVSPEPGHYHAALTVHFSADEPCTFFIHARRGDSAGRAVAESLFVGDSLGGFVTAVDRAGNRGAPIALGYVVDSSAIVMTIAPREGLYNTRQKISLFASNNADAYYSFDPLAPTQAFSRYQSPVELPVGNTIVRYFAKNKYGWESAEGQAHYTIDTVLPKIHLTVRPGEAADTLVCFSKKNAVIRYAMGGAAPGPESPRYEKPLVVAHRGLCIFKAVAKDLAGNSSEIFEWRRQYETAPITIAFSRTGGVYHEPLELNIRCDRAAKIVYTLDGSQPTSASMLYKDRIMISYEGTTAVRAMAIDESGMGGPVIAEEFTIDSHAPDVRVRIEESPKGNTYAVSLIPDKAATIYYEIGEAQPTTSSPVYKEPLILAGGQAMRYFAVDASGNRSVVKTMDDLRRPLVSAYPHGGVFNRRIKIGLTVNAGASALYRLPPDTVFRPYMDSIALVKEGAYSLEYYAESSSGLRSVIRRNEYTVDLTPPHVAINVKKGVNDSVIVFFQCTKNATIYYTIDGTSPFYSATTRTLGNKFLQSQGRLSLLRKQGANIKLAFYAEDIAGNQSSVTVLDVFKPTAVPSVPSGPDILYNRILSISLNAYDDRSQIYFARHGHTPTLDSAVFSTPITLLRSDTIVAFVVDAAGYRGEPDTFVYRIDLPPSPDFSFTPDSVTAGTTVAFDAAGTIDHESRFDKLLFRWNFIDDAASTSDFKPESRVRYRYSAAGLYHPTLEVKDENGGTAKISKEILVRSPCPRGMLSIALTNGKTYCIDQYEWPNIAGAKPLTGVSWVQAKMSCMEAGKRLCASGEWVGACKGLKQTSYPYGNAYRKKACSTEGAALSALGSMPACESSYGVYDMTGNAWEWVEDKKDDYPLMYGGSFTYGEKADCNLSSQGSVGSKSDEVGFRCCK